MYVVPKNLFDGLGWFFFFSNEFADNAGYKENDTIWMKSSQLNNIPPQLWVTKEILSNQLRPKPAAWL